MTFTTADLFDEHGDVLSVAAPLFTNYGGAHAFRGLISTLKVYEDNTLVRESLEKPGKGRVLVIDGGGSLRCALVGDKLAQLAKDNGWSGLIVFGCIRDSRVIADIDIGVKALQTNPCKSKKQGAGHREIPIRFAKISFSPGDWVYADADGIVVAEQKLD